MNKKNKIKIVVNGKLLTVNLKFSLKKLIEKLKTPINKVAIELNKKIIIEKIEKFGSNFQKLTTDTVKGFLEDARISKFTF